MNTINRNIKSGNSSLLRHTAVILAGAALFTLPAAVLADTAAANDSASYEVEKQVSASEAKRLARLHLSAQGFSNRLGPGGAKVQSITRDAGTWIINARFSYDAIVMNEHYTFYIDAQTGVVSDVLPKTSPAQVASE